MPKTKHWLLLLIHLLFYTSIFSQTKEATIETISLTEVLKDIESEHNIIFNYKTNLLDSLRVRPLSRDLSLNEKIENLSIQTNLVFKQLSKAIISISKRVKLCGYIKDEYFQEPLEGATINSGSIYAISDINGYFELELESAEDVLLIRHIGFKTIERQAQYFNLKQCDAITMFEQEEMISTVLLTSYLVKGIDRSEDWTTTIDYSKFSLLPGLIESDVLQTVQALPSIISSDETVSNLNIRGGSNDQNLILWDDIRMYQTGHFFGLISSFNPHLTQTASVINNGTDVSYTDGVSGTIHMKTQRKVNSDFEGLFGINFLNADLYSNIPLGQRSSLQVSARKSLDDFVRTPTYEAYFERITQDSEVIDNMSNIINTDQTFNFYDTAFRWLYNLTEDDIIRINFINNSNDLSFNETSNFDDVMASRQSEVSQSTLAFGLDYQKKWNKKNISRINIYNTDYKLQARNADILAEQLLLQENKVSETRIKIENEFTNKLSKLKYGYDFTETEVINLNDIDLPRFVRRDEEVIREHAVYGQWWYKNDETDFSIRGGVRANLITGEFNEVLIEPRISVRKALNDNLQFEALGEFKHQNISQIVNFQNDFLGIEKRRWQLTDNDSIPILRSKQVSLGLNYNKEGWLLDGKLYYKTVDGITTQSQSFTTKYEFERERGSYDAFGFEFLCRKKINQFSNWLSYSFIKNTYTFENLEEVEFPSNFDISHVITIGSTYSNEHWNVSAGANYRIGRPTSIPIESDEIVDNTINYDNANTERLQDYFRLDASALYKFNISKTFRAETGVSFWNISNRQNVINNYFRIDKDTDSVEQFSRFSLGFTTNAVFRLYF